MSGEAKRKVNRLSPMGVQKLKAPGYFADGAGLYLQVSPSLTKSWIYRYTLNGRSREMGLGPLQTLGLAEARKRAAECRLLVLDGFDPIDARKIAKQKKQLEDARSMTFAECAKKYIDSHRDRWKNPKHASQWENTLATYVNPVFGSLPVQDVDTTLVLRVLEPLWREKTETGSRVRGRIESVLSWATSRGLRVGENPARWRGHIETQFPKRSEVSEVRHQPALPYEQIGAFVAELRRREGVAALALEFGILTAVRSGEVRGAVWDEIDTSAAIWTIPAARMKMKAGHTVPLSPRAIEIIEQMKQVKNGDYVFPAAGGKKPLSDATLAAVIKRMNGDAEPPKWRDPKQNNAPVVPHGFRSTFRDWAGESTNFPREIAEKALAHAIGSKVESAYLRGDLFEKRRQLMNAWERFCNQPKQPAEVLPIRRIGGARS